MLIFHYFDDKLGLCRALMLRTKQYLFACFEETFDRIFAGDGERVTAERVRILAWEAAEGWQTFASCAPHHARRAGRSAHVALSSNARRRQGLCDAELDPRLLLFTTLVSLPLVRPGLAAALRGGLTPVDADSTSPGAIAHAREQITGLGAAAASYPRLRLTLTF